jgi:hypothetical protein
LPLFTVLVPPLCVLLNHLRVILLVGLKVMLPEGVKLGVRLFLWYGKRLQALLVAAIVLDHREVVPLHPEIALAPARNTRSTTRLRESIWAMVATAPSIPRAIVQIKKILAGFTCRNSSLFIAAIVRACSTLRRARPHVIRQNR